MKDDIKNKEDIYKLVKYFYIKLMSDAEMHHFFINFRNPKLLEEHLQVLVSFWDNVLFYSGGYRKNAMKPHMQLHQTKPFEAKHFKRWLSIFNGSIDDLFFGRTAQTAKEKALSIATVMEIKISALNS
ncbi:MAG: group III truncated hemoglobin [Lutibacter sp.]|uniref:group III truncated hemoglobin n=1 Tax=Lutibacter sp. TaxID=1925666 RepID=UPI0017CF8B5D|nr:group III truncated hemoglobin [Lutibacter sp.]MBT8316574.1 group III truncated hemoglobin [Lutibacter sp.]NNJ57434.1 group III truncated hemoglobin [Lutibacter sp.]